MTSLDQTIKEFLETWERRKTGALPSVDLKVACSTCGCQVMGDDRVEFGLLGLVCESCFKGESR